MDANETLVAEIVAKRESAEKPQVAPKPKHAGGRPTKYDASIHPQLAFDTSYRGGTILQISLACGINIDTVYEWVKIHPEFSDAVTRARADADARVEGSMFGAATAADVPAAKNWLSNRRPDFWREKTAVEISNKDGEPFEVNVNGTAVERLARALNGIAAREAAGADPESSAAD